MKSLDRMSPWMWAIGVIIFGGYAVVGMLLTIGLSAAWLTLLGLVYAIALGRSLVLRSLRNQGR